MSLASNLQVRSRLSIPTDGTRVALARDIHDGIAQDLVALGYSIDSILARPELDSPTRSELRQIRLKISTCLDRVRHELYGLRLAPTISLRADLEEHLRALSSSFQVRSDIEDLKVSPEIHLLIIDVAKELIRNAVTHSHGSSLWLTLLTTPTHLVLTVKDDGSGSASLLSDRLGLVGARERLLERGGDLTITGKHGSTITASLPLSEV